MSTIEEYMNNPDQLLDLVREVIDRLAADDNHIKSEIVAMEAQLRVVARAVDNLEKQNIPVLDTLRAEKTRLAAAVAVQSEASLKLNQLIEGIQVILNERKPATPHIPEPKTPRRTGRRRSTSPKTSRDLLRELIIEALRHYGGAASKRKVHEYIEEKLNGRLLPGDMEWRESSRNYAWQNNTDWERYEMTQDGTLKQGSPSGTWELSEEYR
mgnify:CR=1 FL=1